MLYQINDNLSFILCDFVTLNTIFLLKLLLHCKSQINTDKINTSGGAQVAYLSLSDPAAAVQPGISRLPKDYAPDEEDVNKDEDEVLIAKNKAMT